MSCSTRFELGGSSQVTQFKPSFKADTYKQYMGTSLVIQWLRIHLPMQGTLVRSLVGELKAPQAKGQLSLHAATREACLPQWRPRALPTPHKKGQYMIHLSCMDVRVGPQRKLSGEELMLLTEVLEKILESPLNCKEIKSILKEINPEYSLEGLMLKLKFQYFGHRCKELTH